VYTVTESEGMIQEDSTQCINNYMRQTWKWTGRHKWQMQEVERIYWEIIWERWKTNWYRYQTNNTWRGRIFYV